MVKSQNPKQSTTEHKSRKKTACSVRRFLDQEKTGNAIAENIKESDTKASSATNAVLKSLAQKLDVKEWDTLNLPLLSHICGSSEVFQQELELCLISLHVLWSKLFTM